MTTKTTKGYTKIKIGQFDLMKMLTEKALKDPKEPFEVWFNRKTKETIESINSCMDEKGTC